MTTSEFQGQVAVVTGGASGIGLACVQAFAAAGAAVLMLDQDAETGARVAAALADSVHFVRADVRVAAEVEAAFAQADARWGSLDILVSNAGVNLVGHLDELDEAAWDRCLDVNLKGAFLTSRAALPRLRQRGRGSIVFTASNAGLLARAADPAYCASKAGLIMLARSMALAHAPERIRVNAVCPGPVGDTHLMNAHLATLSPEGQKDFLASAPMAAALERLITPAEVAATILFLCSAPAAMITGAVLPIDGGKSAGAVR